MSDPAAAITPVSPTEEEMKMMKKEAIWNNFVTPLAGQYLNLPKQPVEITCPACQVRAPSEIFHDPKWYTQTVNKIYSFFFVLCCCCCCLQHSVPCKKLDMNHYCKNCGCYFGRVMKPKKFL